MNMIGGVLTRTEYFEACKKYNTITAERLLQVDPIPLNFYLEYLKTFKIVIYLKFPFEMPITFCYFS